MKTWIILLTLLSSCSANYHLRQAIKKNPAILKEQVYILDTMVMTDSFSFLDTFETNSIDTIIAESGPCSTIIYKNKDRLIVEQKVKSDTIRIEKKITLPGRIEYKTIHKTKWSTYAAIFLMVGGFLIGTMIKK